VFESRGVVHRDILGRERDTLGWSEQIEIVRDAEVSQEVVQLGDEEARREEVSGLVAQTRRVATAELVVEHDETSTPRFWYNSACGSMYQCEMPGPPFRTTTGRVPDLRSPKTVYDVLNTSEPTLKDAVFVAIVVGS